MALEQNKIQYLDTWDDVKEYSKKKHDAAEKEKDQHNVTKSFVNEQISSAEKKDNEEEQAEYAKIYQKIDDISAGGGADLTPYLKKTEAAETYATKSEIPSVSGYATTEYVNQEIARVEEEIPEMPDLSDYAKKSDIPDVSSFVTEETVDEKVATEIAKVVADAPEDFDTLKEVADYIASDKTKAAEIETAISNLESGKADASTVYTKQQADAKFLTEHQDLTDYAKKTDIPSVENLATKAEVEAVDDKVDAIVIPDVSNFATKDEIPSIEGLVTEQQMTAALEDKATIAQVSEVDQKVDAIVIPDTSAFITEEALEPYALKTDLPDTSNFATKAEVAAVEAQIPSVDGFVTTEQLTAAVSDKATISQVEAVEAQIPDVSNLATKDEVEAVVAQIPDVSNFATKDEIPSIEGLATTEQLNDAVEVVNVELDKKADTVDVSTAVESIETSLDTKADADNVYTKEVCDNKFLTEHQDLSEYAKTVDVSDGYVPIGEYNALVDKVKVLSAYIDSFVTVDPKKREEANDTIIESLSDDNISVVVPSEIKSIVYPETTKGLTVVAPLADDSSVQITSEKYFYLDNTSETGNTSTAITGIDGATSATTCYLTGTFDTLTLTNISVSKSSSKNAAVVSNVVIPNTNETNISLSVVLTEGATITNNSDKDVTITNQSGGETAQPTVYVVAPNSTVTVSSGQYGTFESTVGDNTLYISKSAHINKLIVKKGNVIVNDYEVESHIDEIENETEYTVTPKTIEVTSQSEWTKASGTPALYEVQNDFTSTTRIAPGIFGSQAKIKLNSHTVTCTDANGAFVLRGSSHYIIENGELDCSAYGIWLAGAGTVELKDVHIIANNHALYIEKTGGNIYTTGNCRFEVSNDDKRYVANYLDATYSGGWTHGFHFGENTEFVDFNPAASMGEVGGPVNLLDEGYHTESYTEGEHTIYKVVKDSE